MLFANFLGTHYFCSISSSIEQKARQVRLRTRKRRRRLSGGLNKDSLGKDALRENGATVRCLQRREMRNYHEEKKRIVEKVL
jgi:hypothetical protein